MITTIRKHFKKSTLQIVVFITLASMLGADFLRKQASKSSNSTIAATIDGYEIPLRIFKARVREQERIIGFFKAQFGESADIILQAQGLSGNAQEDVMKSMTREVLLDKAADKLNLNISHSYIANKLSDQNILLFEHQLIFQLLLYLYNFQA